MSFSLSADGTVRSRAAMVEHAKKNGLCQVCGEIKTHERIKQRGIRGMLTEQKFIPVTVQRNDGSYEVYKGYCLHPRCYTLKQAKRELGEQVNERRSTLCEHNQQTHRTQQSLHHSRPRLSLPRDPSTADVLVAACTSVHSSSSSSLSSSTLPRTDRRPSQLTRPEALRTMRSQTAQSSPSFQYVPPPPLSSPASTRSSHPSLAPSSISESPPPSPSQSGYRLPAQSHSPVRSPASPSSFSLQSIAESSRASSVSSSSSSSPLPSPMGSSYTSRRSSARDSYENVYIPSAENFNHVAIPDIHVESGPSNQTVTTTATSSPIESANQVKINEMKSLLREITTSGDIVFAMEMIYNAMESNQYSAPIQSFLLTSIRDLCKKNDDHKDLAMGNNTELNLHKKIVLAMKFHTSESQVQEAACKCILTLAKTSKHRRKFSEDQLCKHVLQALEDHMDQQELVCTALDTILTFSTDADFKRDFVALEGKALVLQSMEAFRTCADVQKHACVILSNFSLTRDNGSDDKSDSDSCTDEVSLVSERELKAVVDSINYNREDDTIVFRACFALKNWTFRKENLKQLEEVPGVLELLQDAADSLHSEKTRRTAAVVLERLVVQRTKTVSAEDELREYCQDIENGASVGNIIRIMQEHNMVNISREGLQCLWLLANESPFQRDTIVESGAPREIISHMYRYKSNAGVQEKGCELLDCLARGNEAGRAAIIRVGGSRAIVNAIQNHEDNKDVQRVAFEALTVLSSEFECWFDLEQDGSIDAVGRAFQRHAKRSAGVERSGSVVLSNFSMFRSQNNITVG